MEPTFSCKVCGKKFKYKKNLNRHANELHVQLKFKCAVCNVTVTRRDVLQRHISEVHSNESYTCDVCNKNFKSKRQLAHHCVYHNTVNTQIVEQSTTQHIPAPSTSKHQSAPIPEPRTLQHQPVPSTSQQQRSLIPKPSTSRLLTHLHPTQQQTLKAVVMKELKRKPEKSEDGGIKSCVDKVSHGEVKPFSVDHLTLELVPKLMVEGVKREPVEYEDEIKFCVDKVSHDGVEPFSVDNCTVELVPKVEDTNEIFDEIVQDNNKKGHVERRGVKLTTEQECYEDNNCETRAESLSKANLCDQVVNTNEKRYTCDFCTKSYSSKRILKTHMRLHTGEKPYTCKTCKKQFTDNSSFNRHKYIHSVEKPYKCDKCNKSFCEKSNLKRHVNIHSGERPFECAVCGASFFNRYRLNKHMEMHQKEHFQCNVCSKTFSEEFMYDKHKLTHSIREPHAFDISDKSIVQKNEDTQERVTVEQADCETNSTEDDCDAQARSTLANLLYMCRTCSKAFTTILEFKVHKCVH